MADGGDFARRGSSVPAAVSEAEASPLDRLLDQVESQPVPAALPSPPRLALVRGERLVGQAVLVRPRSGAESLEAEIGDELDRALLGDAIRDGQLLLAEWPESGPPVVVGVVQTRPPSRLHFAAEEIALDASRELLLRSGAAALRLRASGEVELVGSRISAVSRGVMRLIGRLLRLN